MLSQVCLIDKCCVAFLQMTEDCVEAGVDNEESVQQCVPSFRVVEQQQVNRNITHTINKI